MHLGVAVVSCLLSLPNQDTLWDRRECPYQRGVLILGVKMYICIWGGEVASCLVAPTLAGPVFASR